MQAPQVDAGGLDTTGKVIAEAAARLMQLARARRVDAKALADRLDAPAALAWSQSRALGRPGMVECGKLGFRRPDSRSPGFLPVAASKDRGRIGQALSPFTLVVPHDLCSFATVDGWRSSHPLAPQPLELVWQSAKVDNTCIDATGRPTAQFYTRRRQIFEAGEVKRRYIEKGTKVVCAQLAYREHRPVDYVESRRYYCQVYELLASCQPEYQLLRDLVVDGFNLLVNGFDGGALFATDLSDSDDMLSAGRKAQEDRKFAAACVRRAYVDPSQPFGHERCLAAMLHDCRPWLDFGDPTFGILGHPLLAHK